MTDGVRSVMARLCLTRQRMRSIFVVSKATSRCRPASRNARSGWAQPGDSVAKSTKSRRQCRRVVVVDARRIDDRPTPPRHGVRAPTPVPPLLWEAWRHGRPSTATSMVRPMIPEMNSSLRPPRIQICTAGCVVQNAPSAPGMSMTVTVGMTPGSERPGSDRPRQPRRPWWRAPARSALKRRRLLPASDPSSVSNRIGTTTGFTRPGSIR